MTGMIFNIQRFSVHDGPGIRTTIFFKGCSLRCFWCHNPEGLRRQPEIQYFPRRCIACGACIAVCPHEAHVWQDGVHIFQRDRCQACGACVETCYSEALELTSRRMTVDQVMEEVRRDRAFYETSGGGVTLSGGEPLLQRDFARAILERCRAEGLHTALETAANCRWDDLQALLPATDLIMMDIKHMDADKHRAMTGVSNRRILANARRLVLAGQPVIFRVPVVPGVNDTPQEMQAIAAFVRCLIDLRLAGEPATPNPAGLPSLELLPFHRLAADKYRSLGLDYRAADLEGLSRERMAELAEVARAQGLTVRGG